ncbi:MAG TPA: bifunctional DNA primase/polymerase, partial [Candidatus Thermoplasmatota archaeon]|nr:bifunctional DNA primase/polymerase [Candidatus Thermoplasmatota archaeon]
MTLDEWRAFYRALGFATIPLVPRGKRPLRKGWLAGGEEQWDGAPARANLGVLTGARSGGLVVLDFDTRDGPERVLGMTARQLAVLT